MVWNGQLFQESSSPYYPHTGSWEAILIYVYIYIRYDYIFVYVYQRKLGSNTSELRMTFT